MLNKKSYKIGIGVTEHNRPDVFKNFLQNVKKYMPKDAKLVIVDDASEVPIKEATYRFEQNVGIARAKNKCLELLQDCDHIFLFDSDCWPKSEDWWKPYVEGKEPHYSYIFKDFINQKLNDCKELYRTNSLVAYTHARGCMLYIHRSCLDAVGGMDVNYKRWGYEHVDYSNRIYNVGLTLFRYMDVPNSSELIHSEDEHQAVNSTVSMQERQPYLLEMKGHFERSFESKAYCNFVERAPSPIVGTEDVVLASYFTGHVDPQRGVQWQASINDIMVLANSMKGQKLVVLNDCFEGNEEVPANVELVKVETALNPYFQRWISEYEYLRDHPEIRKVFHVDATDVEMLHNPFEHMEDGKLYVGSEKAVLYIQWMVQHHKVPFLIDFFKKNARQTLLNCGLVGGSRADVMDFMHRFNTLYSDKEGKVGEVEMGLFNYVCRTFYQGKLVTGLPVHTLFKAYDTTNPTAWWRHK